jgi:uncharacterized membrane protein
VVDDVPSGAAAATTTAKVLGVGVGLQGVGTAETAYLTFLKLTSAAPALCTAQGSCEAVLSSQWSQVCAGQRHEGSYYPPSTCAHKCT